jgi:hypothetical protein
MLLLMLSLFISTAEAGELIVANNTRITYDFGHDVKPYIANEIKIVSDGLNMTFDANKFRVGARYKINDYVRIDPHLAVDNKRKDDWIFSPGPAIRLDITF